MSVRRVMAKEMAKSNGSARMVKVPADRRPTVDSLRKLEREISAQVNANEIMRSRSMHKVP